MSLDDAIAQVGARAIRVRAANPGPMTLDGTNTWLLAEPGARRFAELSGAPVRAVDPAFRFGFDLAASEDEADQADGGLPDETSVEVDGLRLRVVRTPGHTADSVCLLVPADRAILSGDTVLGRGSTIVAFPDGRLADYVRSLRRLRELVDEENVTRILPGHGPVIEDPRAALDGYLAHREERLAQVRQALDQLGAAPAHVEPAEIVRLVYADTPQVLWPAAELSVRAQLDYLVELSERQGNDEH
jgi:glyoxylase-like metal-dependent hydrolase (beta-lactamase superfamily II)